MTNIWPLFVWSQPGQRMSRSPGLMGSTDVRQREGDTVYWGGERQVWHQRIRGVIVVTFLWCHLWCVAQGGSGQCHYRALSWTLWPAASLISTKLQRDLTLIYFHNLNLECQLVQQQSFHCHPTARPTALHRVDTDSGPDTGGQG